MPNALRVEPAEVERLWREGRTTVAIGRAVGITRERVRQILAARGIKHLRIRAVGDRLEEAASLYKQGASLTSAAKSAHTGYANLKMVLRAMGLLRPRALPAHGTPSRYGFHGCRCSVCKAGNTSRHRKYARRRGTPPRKYNAPRATNA